MDDTPRVGGQERADDPVPVNIPDGSLTSQGVSLSPVHCTVKRLPRCPTQREGPTCQLAQAPASAAHAPTSNCSIAGGLVMGFVMMPQLGRSSLNTSPARVVIQGPWHRSESLR